jgi:glycosyltransferase involved in cell wall biosynthesis
VSDISVIICTHTRDRWAEVLSAVASVQHQSVPADEVVVVIDHNESLLGELRAELEGVRVIANRYGPGASGSRNTGVAAVGAPVVAFLDDDAEAEPDWLERTLPCYGDERVLGVGGAIEPNWPPHGRPPWFPHEFDWVIGCTYPGLPHSIAPVRNLIAANMSVRRDVFAALGGFRVGFGKAGLRSGTEETDLCIRATQQWPDRFWLHHPEVRVRHRVPPGRTRYAYFLGRCYDEGIAKASIVSFVGSDDGLASERAYTRRILPNAVLTYLRAAACTRDHLPLLRAGAIVSGLAVTSAGYVRGRAVDPMPLLSYSRRDAGPLRQLLHRWATAIVHRVRPAQHDLENGNALDTHVEERGPFRGLEKRRPLRGPRRDLL